MEDKPVVSLSKYREWTDFERKSFDNAFFGAQAEKQKGNLTQAIDLFSKCLTIDSKNAPVMFELAQLYMNNNQISQALFYAKNAEELDDENIWYKYLLANIYKANGDYTKEIEIVKSIIKEKPKLIELRLSLAEAYTNNRQYNDAIKELDFVEKKMGASAELSAEKRRVYIQSGNLEGAVQEVKKLIKRFPEDLENYYLLGSMFSANDQWDEAKKVYLDLLKRHPKDGRAHFSLSEIYKEEGDEFKSQEHLEKAFSGNFLTAEDKLKIIFSFFQQIDSDSTLVPLTNDLVAKSLKLHPKEKGLHAIAGDLSMRENDTAQAIFHYEKAYEYGMNEFNVLVQLMNLHLEQKTYESVKQYANEGVEKFPFQALSYLYGGIASSILEDHQQAIDFLEKGKGYVFSNVELMAQFYSSLGDAYHQLGNNEKSDEYYDKALSEKPNNAFVLNNYAYYLSLRNIHLDKAREMIELAIELDPTSTSYMDTYGWVLYKQGHYEEALKWIKKAIDNDANPSAEVLEHYGDALFKSGNKKEAMEYWNQAKNAGGKVSEFLDKKISTEQIHE